MLTINLRMHGPVHLRLRPFTPKTGEDVTVPSGTYIVLFGDSLVRVRDGVHAGQLTMHTPLRVLCIFGGRHSYAATPQELGRNIDQKVIETEEPIK